MAKKKVIDITQVDEKELMEQVAEAREKMRKHNFTVAGAKPTDAHEARMMRKQVARVLTELNRRKRQ